MLNSKWHLLSSISSRLNNRRGRKNQGISVSVKIIDNSSFFGYRTRRSVGGKIHQEYFSLRKNGRKLSCSEARFVKQFAERRDAELEKLQVQFKRNQMADQCYDTDVQLCSISQGNTA